MDTSSFTTCSCTVSSRLESSFRCTTRLASWRCSSSTALHLLALCDRCSSPWFCTPLRARMDTAHSTQETAHRRQGSGMRINRGRWIEMAKHTESSVDCKAIPAVFVCLLFYSILSSKCCWPTPKLQSHTPMHSYHWLMKSYIHDSSATWKTWE